MFKRCVILFFLFASLGSSLFGQPGTDSERDFKTALTLIQKFNYKKAIGICNSYLNTPGLDLKKHSLFLSLKGQAYLDTLSADSGKYFLETALTEAYKTNNTYAINTSLSNLGKYYYRNSNYKTSLKYYQLLENYASQKNDKDNLLIAYYNISSNYNLMGAFKPRMLYAQKSAQIAFELKDTISYIKSLTCIANEFFIQVNIDSAEHYCKKILKAYDQFSDKKRGLGADVYNTLLKTEILKKNYEKAVYYGKLAIAECLEHNYLTTINIFYDNVAISYTDMKMYDSAIRYFEKALLYEEKYNYVDEYKADLKELYRIHKLLHHNEKAQFYFDKFLSADTLYNRDTAENIDSLKNAFEEEKNALVIKSEKEKLQILFKQKQKYYLFIGGVSLFFAALLFYVLYTRYKFRKEKEKQNLMIQIKDSEIKALQAQINPHFIFNSLNSILEYIRKSEKEEAIVYLTKFAKLIRMVLQSSNKRSISVADEIELLRLYMDLENFRFNHNFKCTINVEEGMDIHDMEIPSLIIQPFIENSILHGLQNKFSILNEQKQKFMGQITLSFSAQEKFLKCVIEDNGIGREKAEEIKKNKLLGHQSMGMRITKDRLDLLSSSKCEIEFIDLKDDKGEAAGTRVEILIPLINEF